MPTDLNKDAKMTFGIHIFFNATESDKSFVQFASKTTFFSKIINGMKRWNTFGMKSFGIF